MNEYDNDSMWFLIFLMLVSDDCNVPVSERIKQFKEQYKEEERIKILEEMTKNACERIERFKDMNATIEICRDTGEPCDMHCVRRNLYA